MVHSHGAVTPRAFEDTDLMHSRLSSAVHYGTAAYTEDLHIAKIHIVKLQRHGRHDGADHDLSAAAHLEQQPSPHA